MTLDVGVQDLGPWRGFGAVDMNGFSPPRNPNPQGYSGRSPAPNAGGRLVVDGQSNANNFDKNAPRLNSKNAGQPQSSLVDLDDAIQVHLLTETALFDSRRFEILSQEEVDDLKKQCQSLTQRIEKTRSNLVVQNKYRDAAVSMAKLYSPAGRQSPSETRGNNRNSAQAVELERQASERKCEELGAELADLEKRIMTPQRRLLEHTAAILQLTHNASRKQLKPPPNMPMMNGIPGSPESLYTYSNDRGSIDDGDDAYLDLADPSDRMRARNNLINIPPKSSARSKDGTLQDERDRLRQENDRLREETSQLRAQSDALGLEVDALRREGSDQGREVADLERKLDSLMKREQEQQSSRSRSLDAGEEASATARIDALNKQVTDLLLRVNATPPPPPNPAAVGRTDIELDDRISYLQYALRVVETEMLQANEAANIARSMPTGDADAEPKLRELWDIVQSGFLELQRQREGRRKIQIEKGLEEEEEEMTIDQTFDLDEGYSAISLQSRVKTVASQINKLTEQKFVLKRQIKQQRELNSQSSSEKDTEIQNRDAEIERRIEEAQKKEMELQGRLMELDTREAEVAELQGQVRDLNDRLIEAQSASGNGANNEARVKELEAELADAKQYLEQSRADATQTQGMLVSALRDLDTANQQAETRESEGLKAARAELEEKRSNLAALEAKRNDLESRLNMTEASRAELQTRMDGIDGKIESLEIELLEAKAALKAAEAASEFKQRELDGNQREIKEKDDVLESLNLMVVELKTELTIAKAELDGAYGSRAERAADMAAIKSSDEVEQLKSQINTYKEELDQTLKQLEEVTRETIAAEREKIEVEMKLDDAVAVRSTLEGEIRELTERLDSELGAARERINTLQEELDTARLKVAPGEGGGGGARSGAGAAMLSEQFRTTMRVERKKFQEDLREEQAKRRKLEEELSRLRRAQGPGKSPLSPGRA
ncbi:uncharacterized protein DNG_08372 [Cephalotrichum gorgonifer]|uniref:Up-regulated during septation protein 1 domain-containing protein n=1 Tax=Cephalotrichum gorgonifer TaxID=2041049 RepID=A0AAE8SYA5_9PEZI|nr:uncharacterized protein DNG_08372 [Cephalotrichum gorgonifer]